MRPALAWFGRIVGVVFLLAIGFGAWKIFLDGRAPAQRPDLAHIPAELGPAPAGYPTLNAIYLAFMLGMIEPADLGKDQPAPANVAVEKDLVYGKVGDRDLMLDVYYPKVAPAKPVPMLVFIHGGGWSGGKRGDYQIYCNRFAEWGYVVATISYRFHQEAKFPACVQDTNAALRWMRAHGARFGGDPERMAVLGGSAGGYLAMMAAYASDVPELQGDAGNPGVSSRVQAIVNLYGPSDLTTPEAQVAPQVTGLIGKSFAEVPETYKLASPLSHLDKDDPPTLIVHGTLDQVVTVLQSDALAERLKDLGTDYWYDRADGWPHTFDIVLTNFEHTSKVIRAFLQAKGLGTD